MCVECVFGFDEHRVLIVCVLDIHTLLRTVVVFCFSACVGESMCV